MELKFNVKMDNESTQKHEVVVEMDFSEATREQLIEMCKKPIIINLQSQIRNNWDKFLKGDYPKSLKFGESLFASTRGVVTVDRAKGVLIAQLSTMTPEQKLEYLKSIGLL